MKFALISIVLLLLFAIVWKSNTPTPSMRNAAESGSLYQMQELLNSGMDVNTRYNDGLSALHISAQSGHREMIKLLLDNRADINSRTRHGVTPLHFAAQEDNYNIVKLLLQRGASVNAADDQGATPLDWAALAIKIGSTKSNAIVELLELYTDAAYIWSKVQNEAAYKRAVEQMRNISVSEFNSFHIIKRTDQEIQEYLVKLKKLR